MDIYISFNLGYAIPRAYPSNHPLKPRVPPPSLYHHTALTFASKRLTASGPINPVFGFGISSVPFSILFRLFGLSGPNLPLIKRGELGLDSTNYPVVSF
jgi:hypothetical protein